MKWPLLPNDKKKEIRLEQSPWITQGLLVSMGVRDRLYKRRKQEKDEQVKNEINECYKRYRKSIGSLLKRSKQDHYASIFIQNQSNLRKTCDGIRSLINVFKKEKLTNF